MPPPPVIPEPVGESEGGLVAREPWERRAAVAVPIGGSDGKGEESLGRRGWRDGVDATRFVEKEKLRGSVEVPSGGRRKREGQGRRRRRWLEREVGRL